jgi:RNA polymerase sigma factor (sigma-70 family)
MMTPRPTPVETSDTPQLQQAFHAGDVEAFAELVSPHLDAMYTVCLRITGSHAEAQDVVQDALARAMERHALYRPSAPLRPWILTIAINLCRGRLRSPWWRRLLFAEEEVRSQAPGIEQVTDDNDRDRKVRIALARVPMLYREALSLFYLDDMSYAEMAAITGDGIPALKQRVRRGKEMLKAKVTELYPELALDRIDR